MTIVDQANLIETVSYSPLYAALDTETTGLRSFKNDRLFSVILSDDRDDFYFNFISYPKENILGLDRNVLKHIAEMGKDRSITWFMQNAKFDMHMLAKEGIIITGKVYDLQFLDRIYFNQSLNYSLAEISKRWGEEKLDSVMIYVKENRLKTIYVDELTKKEEEKLHFDMVPFSLIAPYGCKDGRSTLEVGKKIIEAIKKEDSELLTGQPKQMQVVENEARLVHTLFRMEQIGIQIDRSYCEEALAHYFKEILEVETKFKELTGFDFVKGTLVFEEVFKNETEKWEKTEKGNWRWDADVLKTFTHPAAELATQYAEAKKQSEYFANFLFYADRFGVLHPEFKQHGTVTGRLSSSNPNIQNLTSPDKYEDVTEGVTSLYSVRKAMVPRPGYFFVMLDYSQMEFRILLDMARANSLINEVLSGLDVHTATAKVSGTSRKEAKTNNFLTAYGGGVVKLASNLYTLKGSRAQSSAIYKSMFGWRLSSEEATALNTVTSELREHNEPLIRKAYNIQQAIFKSAPEIKDFLKRVQKRAEQVKYIRNWLGRRYQFPDSRWSYRAPNHLIQGGAADVVKVAMNRADEYLLDKQSRMLLSVHDEIDLEVKFGEEYVVEVIKSIMESVYPHNRLPLLVDVEYSYTNLADKSDWPPPHLKHGPETGNYIPPTLTQEIE